MADYKFIEYLEQFVSEKSKKFIQSRFLEKPHTYILRWPLKIVFYASKMQVQL